MIVQLERTRFEEFAVPEQWASYLQNVPGGVRLMGDRTGYRDLYLWNDAERLVVATDLIELLTELKESGEPVEISDFGLSSFLHNGLVPLPHTVYRGITAMSMGDSALITARSDGFEIQLDHQFEWTPRRWSNGSDPDPATLLKLLTASTERQLAESPGDAFLMLSSGKDSPAVALSLLEGGFTDVTCVTYSSGKNDPEPPVAAEICRRLGLSHEIVEMPRDPDRIAESLLAFFSAAPMPGTDLSQIPYVLAMGKVDAGSRYDTVLDGGGNDSYMGYPVKGHDLFKQRYRIRGKRLSQVAQRILPVDSRFNYLARSRVEASLPGRTMRNRHIKSLYPDAVDISSWWYDTSKAARGIDVFTLFAEFQERYTNASQTLQKQRLAAAALGLNASLPWCDDDIADFYFGLPEQHKYDTDSGTNKILLRQMLAHYLDYDADSVGKHYFEFDGVTFIKRNMEFVRSEIDAVDIWDAKGLKQIHRWLDAIDSRPLLYHSLLTVFMISGWYNHNPYVTKSVGGRLDPSRPS